MKIKIFDSIGNELNIGDLVQLQEERNGTLTFYTRIQVINGSLFPINKFCFDRMIKVDSIPSDCNHCEAKPENNFPEYWMHPKTELYLIENNHLNQWKMDKLMFDENLFMKIEE